MFSDAFINVSNPIGLRNINCKRFIITNHKRSHIYSNPSSFSEQDGHINDSDHSNSSYSFSESEVSHNADQSSDINKDNGPSPGQLTEEDIWKMKAAISQNSTLGIDWVNTIKTLQTSPYCTVSPLTIAYNSALSAAERNCNADLCFSLLEDMKKCNEKVIDSVSYKIAIMTCIKCNRVDDALKLKDEMIEAGMNLDHGIIRSLLWLLSHNGYGYESIKMFEALKKLAELCKNEKGLIQTDYIHTIEACLLTNMFDDAIDVYNKLKKSPNYKLNDKSLKILLDLAYNTLDADLSIELYSQALKEKSFELSKYHYRLIIKTLLMDGNLDMIHAIWKNLLNQPNLFDTILCQMVLESYSIAGDCENAYGILSLMDKERLLTSLQQYVLAIKSCEKCGEWNLALRILRMSQQRLNKSDIRLYNSVLSVCFTAKEWDTMASLYNEIFKDSGSNSGEYEVNEHELVPDGDTIAYMLISSYHLNDQKMIESLLSMPVVETPLLNKIRNSLKQ